MQDPEHQLASQPANQPATLPKKLCFQKISYQNYQKNFNNRFEFF
jgi:hypothetical protein